MFNVTVWGSIEDLINGEISEFELLDEARFKTEEQAKKWVKQEGYEVGACLKIWPNTKSVIESITIEEETTEEEEVATDPYGQALERYKNHIKEYNNDFAKLYAYLDNKTPYESSDYEEMEIHNKEKELVVNSITWAFMKANGYYYDSNAEYPKWVKEN